MRLVLVILTGCYAPSLPEGIPCGDEACPSPLVCASGLCVSNAPPPPPVDSPAACTPIEAGVGQLTVPRIAAPISLDGSIDDWSTCFVTIDPGSAGLVRDLGANGRFASGRFSLAIDADNVIYLAAEVQSVLPLGDQPLPEVYLNNAISTYFDGDGDHARQQYDADAAQIVVDHANRMQAFHSPGGTFDVPDVRSAARTTASTFTIELAVKPSTFGLASFGKSIGFDIGFVGGDGATMTSELVWFQACAPPACGCTNGDAAPYCDPREFGRATIAEP
jgi:hypothetical protein